MRKFQMNVENKRASPQEDGIYSLQLPTHDFRGYVTHGVLYYSNRSLTCCIPSHAESRED